VSTAPALTTALANASAPNTPRCGERRDAEGPLTLTVARALRAGRSRQQGVAVAVQPGWARRRVERMVERGCARLAPCCRHDRTCNVSIEVPVPPNADKEC
jgi:hypothetical protein